ncbi:MAG: methylated-DNA--[protein]-cysteine S-methyltransferase [Nakamurella sp.]
MTFVGNWSAAAPPAPAAEPDLSVTDPVLTTTAGQMAEYFAGDRTEFDLPLAPAGDEFHRNVWRLIAEIPYGETVSYGSIAQQLGGVRLSQAVGGATGRNPLPLVIGCHRVVGADGSLTGFGGGLDRKRFLLALEESDEVKATRLF